MQERAREYCGHNEAKPNMATIQVLREAPKTVAEARAANNVSTVIRVNKVPISANGALAKAPGPAGNNAPLSYITYTIANGAAALTYVIGDPTGMVQGAFNPAIAWSQPTAVTGGAVAAVQASFMSAPVSIKGINYIVTTAPQYAQTLRYCGADRDGRINGQPVQIMPYLRNNQFITTRQTIMFDEPYGFDEFHAFTLDVLANETVTISLLLDANAA